MTFPKGPFFTSRLSCELNWFQKLIFICFGEKRVAIDLTDFGNCRVTAYHLNNITYVRKIEFIGVNEE